MSQLDSLLPWYTRHDVIGVPPYIIRAQLEQSEAERERAERDWWNRRWDDECTAGLYEEREPRHRELSFEQWLGRYPTGGEQSALSRIREKRERSPG